MPTAQLDTQIAMERHGELWSTLKHFGATWGTLEHSILEFLTLEHCRSAMSNWVEIRLCKKLIQLYVSFFPADGELVKTAQQDGCKVLTLLLGYF